jgi:hypothetical protein
MVAPTACASAARTACAASVQRRRRCGQAGARWHLPQSVKERERVMGNGTSTNQSLRTFTLLSKGIIRRRAR